MAGELSSQRQQEQQDRYTSLNTLFSAAIQCVKTGEAWTEAAIMSQRGTAVIRTDGQKRHEVDVYPDTPVQPDGSLMLRNYVFSTCDNGAQWDVYEELLPASRSSAVVDSPLRLKLTGVSERHVAELKNVLRAKGEVVVYGREDWDGFKTLEADKNFLHTLKLAAFVVAHNILQGSPSPTVIPKQYIELDEDSESPLVDDEPSNYLADHIISHMAEFDVQHCQRLTLRGEGTDILLGMHPTGVPTSITAIMPVEVGVSTDIQRTLELKLSGCAYIAKVWISSADNPLVRHLESNDFVTMNQACDLVYAVLDTAPTESDY